DLARGDKWLAAVRISPLPEELHYFFTMTRKYDGGVHLAVAYPKGLSVWNQLKHLKAKHPEATREQLAKLVSLERRALDHAECPQLRRLATKLEALRINPILPDVLLLDATGYGFRFESKWGNGIRVFLPSPELHPLRKWADEVRNTEQTRCDLLGSGPPPGKEF
ncbi:MAG: hypothetical protein ACREB3_04585, partial [Burkholderiales bacterium]